MKFKIINQGDSDVGISGFEVDVEITSTSIDLVEYFEDMRGGGYDPIHDLGRIFQEMFGSETRARIYFRLDEYENITPKLSKQIK
jgi:hypothetical protein